VVGSARVQRYFPELKEGEKYHGFCYHCSGFYVAVPVVLQAVWVLSSNYTLGKRASPAELAWYCIIGFIEFMTS